MLTTDDVKTAISDKTNQLVNDAKGDLTSSNRGKYILYFCVGLVIGLVIGYIIS